jgi:hypothetical protein
MDKIYAVVINFEDWESSTWQTIGHFLSLEEAEEVRDKWEGFFDEHSGKIQSRNSEPSLDEPEIEAYYESYGKYREIEDYVGIEIQEHILGVDLFSGQDSNRTEEMISLVRQWERDYIIDKITKQK